MQVEHLHSGTRQETLDGEHVPNHALFGGALGGDGQARDGEAVVILQVSRVVMTSRLTREEQTRHAPPCPGCVTRCFHVRSTNHRARD